MKKVNYDRSLSINEQVSSMSHLSKLSYDRVGVINCCFVGFVFTNTSQNVWICQKCEGKLAYKETDSQL